MHKTCISRRLTDVLQTSYIYNDFMAPSPPIDLNLYGANSRNQLTLIPICAMVIICQIR